MFTKLMNDIIASLNKYPKKIKLIFPEGTNPKIQEVAKRLVESQLIIPVLCFEKKEDLPHNLNPKIEIVIIEDTQLDNIANELLELRKGKILPEEAKKLVRLRNYFSIMLLKQKKVDAFVGGIEYKTSDILRPTLQIIKTKPNVLVATSANLMFKDQNRYLFADCSLNIELDDQKLASVAESTIELAHNIGIETPKVAMLSFSTLGSGASPQSQKVASATKILQNKKLNAIVDGEIQFDAAISQEVRLKKAPDSKMEGSADVFIFPSLEAGNIGYKIAERLGGYSALGPILLGLNAPVSDLSRGATVDDIYTTSLITAWNVTWE